MVITTNNHEKIMYEGWYAALTGMLLVFGTVTMGYAHRYYITAFQALV